LISLNGNTSLITFFLNKACAGNQLISNAYSFL